MIGPDVFSVEPWTVCERELNLDLLAQTESIFALSNGHIGLRGNLDEGEPSGSPGTYLNSFYEVWSRAPSWSRPELRCRKRLDYTRPVPPEPWPNTKVH